MPFIVDDLLFIWVLKPYLEKLRDDSADDFYAWLKGKGIKLSGKAKKEPDEAIRQIQTRLRNHPEEVEKLTKATIGEAAGGTEEEFMATVSGVLTATFETVQRLGRPVVLPGFLTGAHHLSVIDVRLYRGTEEVQWPRGPFAAHDLKVPTVYVYAYFGASGGKPLEPRLWLVEDTQSNRSQLTKAAASATAMVGDADGLVGLLKEERLVTRLTKQDVYFQIPSYLYSRPILGNVANKEKAIPWSRSPFGYQTMQAELRAAEKASIGEREKWKDALLGNDSPQENK